MVFLTGGTGFIGSYILYYLLQKYPEVRALRRLSSSMDETAFIFKHLHTYEPASGGETWQHMLARVTWVQGDILDMDSLMDNITEGDIVYHAAASVSFSRKDKAQTLNTNIDGTANVVNASLENKASLLAYVSSVAALARKSGEIVNEETEMEGFDFSSIYAESKYRAEMEVWRGVAEGLRSVIINPGIVLGWGDFDKGSAKIFTTVYKGLKYYPQGSNAFVDARDVAKALITLAGEEKAINDRFVAVAENITYKSLFDQMAASLQVKVPYIKANKNMAKLVWLMAEAQARVSGGEPFVTHDVAVTASQHYAYANDKLRKLLNYDFIPVAQSIQDSCQVFRQKMLK